MRTTSALCLSLCLCLDAGALLAQGSGDLPEYDSVRVNGVSIAYLDMGRGEPLVMLHGFLDSGVQWAPLFDDLARGYRLIVPDLRGHGRSTNPSGQFTHRESALDMFALLDELEIDRFNAIGFSSGGMTLIHMATSRPERVGSMVLVGATSYFPEQARQILRANSPDSVSADVIAALEAVHPRGEEQVLALFGQFHGFSDSYDDMNFTAPYLSRITA